MNRLSSRIALVTGAASGIGRATALRLAAEGAVLMLADIDEDGLAQTRSGLPGNGRHAHVRLDVTDSADCAAAVAACIAEFGRLDILCNIAGVMLCERFTEITDEQWRRAVSVNLDGVFFMCRAALPHLVESRGNIVNMSSSAGLIGQAYNAGYCATKAGVLMLSKSLALEYSGHEVRVNAVCPGMVKTPMTAGFTPPEGVDTALMGRLSPLLPAAEPEEIAAAVAYLASDEARFVSGIALSIDGAQTAG